MPSESPSIVVSEAGKEDSLQAASDSASVASGPPSVSGGSSVSSASSSSGIVRIASEGLLQPPVALDMETLRQIVDQQRVVEEIISAFNSSPEEGWKAVNESKMVSPDDPEDMAKLFYDAYGVDPDKLGELLGKSKNAAILDAFVKLNDFRALSIADAVRHMFRKFKPAGESAIIDRIITSFSEAYKRDNPDLFSHPDTVYQLAFAVLLVNTALSNPSALKKAPEMCKSAAAFYRTITRDLCRDEKKITRALVLDLFFSVNLRPIELIRDKYMNIFRDSVRSGWLEKKTDGRLNAWKRRLFALSGHTHIGYALYYFNGGMDRAWRVMIPLNENVVCEISPVDSLVLFIRHKRRLRITAAKRIQDGTVLKSTKLEFAVRCADSRQAQYWCRAINECISESLQERSIQSTLRSSPMATSRAKSFRLGSLSKESMPGRMEKLKSDSVIPSIRGRMSSDSDVCPSFRIESEADLSSSTAKIQEQSSRHQSSCHAPSEFALGSPKKTEPTLLSVSEHVVSEIASEDAPSSHDPS